MLYNMCLSQSLMVSLKFTNLIIYNLNKKGLGLQKS